MLSDRCPVLSVCPVCDVGVLWPNDWMDQDETSHGGRPRPRPHCLRWGPSSPFPINERGTAPPQFSAHVRCGQTAGWIKMPQYGDRHASIGPGGIVLGGDPALPSPKRGSCWGLAPQFSVHVYCGQTARYIRIPLGTEVGLGPGDIVIVLHRDPAPLQKRAHPSRIFGPCLLWPNGWINQDAPW